MQTTLTPVAEAFHNVPAAQPLACGITAHLVDPSHIEPARAWRLCGATHKRHYVVKRVMCSQRKRPLKRMRSATGLCT